MFQTCHDLQLICVVTCCSETANFKYVCFVQSLEHKHHGLAAAVGAEDEQPVKSKEEVKTNEEASDGQLVQDFK